MLALKGSWDLLVSHIPLPPLPLPASHTHILRSQGSRSRDLRHLDSELTTEHIHQPHSGPSALGLSRGWGWWFGITWRCPASLLMPPSLLFCWTKNTLTLAIGSLPRKCGDNLVTSQWPCLNLGTEGQWQRSSGGIGDLATAGDVIATYQSQNGIQVMSTSSCSRVTLVSVWK